MTHSIGLNDLCDFLSLNSGPLSAMRGATAPKRNTLSHANAQRDAGLAEKVFWSVLEHLGNLQPGFLGAKRNKRLGRFRHAIHAVDSTVILLIANCLSWAKHRRRKAAAKLHVRLNLQSLLPQCAIIKTAAEHDNPRAVELCAGLAEGEIVIFDKAYVWFLHLGQLTQRGVF
jgi:Transposase DDE domain